MIHMKKIQLKTWFVYIILLIANKSIAANSLPAPIVLEPKDTSLIQGTQLTCEYRIVIYVGLLFIMQPALLPLSGVNRVFLAGIL